jgi:hypothetical protein
LELDDKFSSISKIKIQSILWSRALEDVVVTQDDVVVAQDGARLEVRGNGCLRVNGGGAAPKLATEALFLGKLLEYRVPNYTTHQNQRPQRSKDGCFWKCGISNLKTSRRRSRMYISVMLVLKHGPHIYMITADAAEP